jgi:iodotyrosine deiodinase
MEKKLINGHQHIRYERPDLSEKELIKNSSEFNKIMASRRTVRDFDSRPVPLEVMENIIRTAGTAPSGAHKQPWTFCLISDPEIKRQIRMAAEEEEKISYSQRMPEDWKNDLKPLGTDWEKPFLEEAPYLIVVFKQSYGIENGEKIQHYYVSESVGIACGFLIAAIHQAGLVTVTHTPSPMNFLSKILERPTNEKPYLLLPVGYPKKITYVPDIERKRLEKILIKYPN